jgi:hypothetical protein
MIWFITLFINQFIVLPLSHFIILLALTLDMNVLVHTIILISLCLVLLRAIFFISLLLITHDELN